jgi:hypothetical protein
MKRTRILFAAIISLIAELPFVGLTTYIENKIYEKHILLSIKYSEGLINITVKNLESKSIFIYDPTKNGLPVQNICVLIKDSAGKVLNLEGSDSCLSINNEVSTLTEIPVKKGFTEILSGDSIKNSILIKNVVAVPLYHLVKDPSLLNNISIKIKAVIYLDHYLLNNVHTETDWITIDSAKNLVE